MNFVRLRSPKQPNPRDVAGHAFERQKMSRWSRTSTSTAGELRECTQKHQNAHASILVIGLPLCQRCMMDRKKIEHPRQICMVAASRGKRGRMGRRFDLRKYHTTDNAQAGAATHMCHKKKGSPKRKVHFERPQHAISLTRKKMALSFRGTLTRADKSNTAKISAFNTVHQKLSRAHDARWRTIENLGWSETCNAKREAVKNRTRPRKRLRLAFEMSRFPAQWSLSRQRSGTAAVKKVQGDSAKRGKSSSSCQTKGKRTTLQSRSCVSLLLRTRRGCRLSSTLTATGSSCSSCCSMAREGRRRL